MSSLQWRDLLLPGLSQAATINVSQESVKDHCGIESMSANIPSECLKNLEDIRDME